MTAVADDRAPMHVLNFRASDALHAQLEAEAAAAGLTLTDLIRAKLTVECTPVTLRALAAASPDRPARRNELNRQLSDQDVRDIRRLRNLQGMPAADIAGMFNISTQTVRDVANGRRYADVTEEP